MAVFMSMHAGRSADLKKSGPKANHAGLMDQVYQRQRYFYDLTRKYYLFGRDSLIAALGLQPGESLVEIGCGTARNLIAIARLYPGVRLFGLDASAEMLKTARTQVAQAGLEDRIVLVQGLAEELTPATFGQASFDHALFSYSLSMIPDWRGAIVAAANTLSGPGRIHIVDFGDLKTMPGRWLLRRWLGLFHVSPREALLQAVEAEVNKANKGLNILPGRYAFRLSIAKGKMGAFACGETVTADQ
jgi:S-adenosylmethionine-diacylgycerolhomoserine-N-methlytransferase